MKIKRIEIKDFKRFTHLIVEGIPQSVKLVVLVGPNGSGKSSFLEAFNFFYSYTGFLRLAPFDYLWKSSEESEIQRKDLPSFAKKMVNISFYDMEQISGRFKQSDIKGHFYFRSAYRNEPRFQIESMQRMPDPTDKIRLNTLIENDQTVSSNYQRIISDAISGVYDDSNNEKTVVELRSALTGKIQKAMGNIFEDIELSSIGKPLENDGFFFTKGISKDFSYCNLSAGEKSAFDLILDLVVQSKFFPNAIYCIDEPETHLHTKLQGKVLRELFNLIPGESQLWLSTHSIGMIKEAEDIEKECHGTVAFLDFGGRDFDTDQIIYPSKLGRASLEKFYELAFGDFAKLVLPATIVFCEGSITGNTRKDFDRTIFTTIFGETHPDTFFISGGSCNEVMSIESKFGGVLQTLLANSKIIKVVDRDDRSQQEVAELKNQGLRVLKRRNLESYLLDDSVIRKLCETYSQKNEVDNCIKEKNNALTSSIARGNASDDLKSASGDIYNALRQILGLTQCGNNADAFIRDTLAPLITPDMEVYKELEREIFGDD